MGVHAFLIEETGRFVRRLRRYVPSAAEKCPGAWGYHNASAPLDVVEAWETDQTSGDLWPHDDRRWPATCEGCGRPFEDSDEWQLNVDHEYRDVVTRDTTTLHDVGPGAMWEAPWLPWKGPDGRTIVVKLPDGTDWIIDSQASNCTRPDDGGPTREHWCWIRHGEPPNLTVNKQGPTCEAGAGSIQSANYHGFLTNGEFVP